MEYSREKIFKRVLGYLKPFRWLFVGSIVLMALFGATDGAVPFIIKKVLDGIFAQKDQEMLAVLPLLLVGFALFRAVCDFGQQFLSSKVGHLVTERIRKELNEKFLTLEPSYFVTNSSADLISRVTSDVMLIRSILTDSVGAVIRDSIRIVALITAAIYLDPILAMIALVGFPLGFYPIYRIGKRLRKLSRRGQEAVGSLTSMMQESILGNRVVKIFLREDFERRRFEGKNRELTSVLVSSEKARALTGPINEVLAAIAVSGVLFFGGYQVLHGERTQESFIAFLISVFLLYDPFKKLSKVSAAIQTGLAGADRIFQILDAQPTIKEMPTKTALSEDSNEIVFRNVSFDYRQDVSVLKSIDLTIEQDKKVAIVGLSGSGKSTLVDLIPRFIDPSSGVVTIGGVNIKEVSLCQLRRKIALVGQHTFLFNDTIAKNIAYGLEGASDEEIFEAAKSAYAIDFIEKLPRGFETVIGESGLNLSGGERQRLAIARAILKRAPILILDEATASLDNKSEKEVQAALKTLEKGRTCVIIAHRLSTVINADMIVVLDNGRIVEQGTHHHLLSVNEHYAKLYSLQLSQ